MQTQIQWMLVFMSICQTLLLLLVICFFKEKDEDLQIDSAEDLQVNESTTSASILDQVKLLLIDRNYMLAMISSSILVSATYSFPTVLAQIILPWGYTSNDASVLGTLYNGSGIIGGIIVSFILNKSRIFKTL